MQTVPCRVNTGTASSCAVTPSPSPTDPQAAPLACQVPRFRQQQCSRQPGNCTVLHASLARRSSTPWLLLCSQHIALQLFHKVKAGVCKVDSMEQLEGSVVTALEQSTLHTQLQHSILQQVANSNWAYQHSILDNHSVPLLLILHHSLSNAAIF